VRYRSGDLRDWLTTIPVIATTFCTVVFMDPVLRLIHRFRPPRYEPVRNRMMQFVIRVFQRFGTRIEVTWSPVADRAGRYIVISNHQANFDILLLMTQLEGLRPRFVATHQLGRGVPVISYAIRQEDFALVNRKRPREAFRIVRDFGRRAGELDISPTVFPEGTRARDGELLPFERLGPATLVKAARDLPILPVALEGPWWLSKTALWPIPCGTTIRFRVLDPIPRVPDEDAVDLVRRAEAAITAQVEDWRR
jgi:1-acyl-sn-glycerol-3-phosphate acyltransferase